MPEFEALGRDVADTANSTAPGHLARAVISLLDWINEDASHNDHLVKVAASKSTSGASVSITVTERDAYVAPVFAIPGPEVVRDRERDEADEPEPSFSYNPFAA